MRYSNIVIEGCRLSHPHVFDTFQHAIICAYGNYTIVKCFYLNPPDRHKHYILRQAKLLNKFLKEKDNEALLHFKREQQKGFTQHLEPPLPKFEVVEDRLFIEKYALNSAEWKHPGLPTGYEQVVKDIAESGTFNPFYQRVEINGYIIIPGFTESEKSWINIKKFNIEFNGKKICDIGCMHGYYSFKAEECGSFSTGIDIDTGAIKAAKIIAKYRNSISEFKTYNSENRFTSKYDIILALNVLHRVSDFRKVCQNIFISSSEAILEVGESQISNIITIGKENQFTLKKAIKSHRNSEVIGQRILLHMQKIKSG